MKTNRMAARVRAATILIMALASSLAVAQTVEFNFENSLSAEDGSWDGEYVFEDEPTTDDPTFVGAGGSQAIDLAPQDRARRDGDRLVSPVVDHVAQHERGAGGPAGRPEGGEVGHEAGHGVHFH